MEVVHTILFGPLAAQHLPGVLMLPRLGVLSMIFVASGIDMGMLLLRAAFMFLCFCRCTKHSNDSDQKGGKAGHGCRRYQKSQRKSCFVRLQRRRQAWQLDGKATFKERRRRRRRRCRRWTREIKEKATLQVPSHLLSALDSDGAETIIPVSHKVQHDPDRDWHRLTWVLWGGSWQTR